MVGSTPKILKPAAILSTLLAAFLPAAGGAQITAPGTDYVTFWSGELRVFAQKDDTEVELVDVDTNAPLSPTDPRVTFFGATANPFVLARAGDMFRGEGGTQSANREIRVRILSRDAGTGGGPAASKPITVWTGGPLRVSNSWGSYLPAAFTSGQTFGREIGRDFLGFTQRELILVAPRVPGLVTQVSLHNFDAATTRQLVLDAGLPPCPPLANAEPPIPAAATPCYLLDDAEAQAVYVNDYTDDRIRVTSNVDVSVLAGFRLLGFVVSDTVVSFTNTDWSSTPPSFAAGEDGLELGTKFFAFVRSGLAIFPTEDATTVTITDLTDGDDSKTLTLSAGQVGQPTYDLYTPYLDTREGAGVVPRPAGPQVLLTTNDENPIDNDVLKIESDKPILVYQGPVGSDVNEFADVAFSVPTGPQSRVVYGYAQNGDANDFQLFAFQRDTQVTITSLSRTAGFKTANHHDFTIDFDVAVGKAPIVTRSPSGAPFVAQPTLGDVQHFSTGTWSGELLRVTSTRPITVITGDYDGPNFGAFIPFVPTTLLLPPQAVLAASPREICPGETAEASAAGSFDQDDLGTPPDVVRFDWDFDDGVTLANGGSTVSHVYLAPGTFAATVTVTDNEAAPDTQTDSAVAVIVVLPFDDPRCDPPPVALCQSPVVFTDFAACSAAVSVDAGSFDPEGDVLAYSQLPDAPYAPVTAAVTLTVADGRGLTDACGATVTVEDAEPPGVDCRAPALVDGRDAPFALSFIATADDNCQAAGGLTVEVTAATCFDDDRDDDGVPDEQDECPDSDLNAEVILVECATGVANALFASGCTISDRILACGNDVRNHGEFVSCVAHLTNELRRDGVITGAEKGEIQRCAAQAPIPPGHPGGGKRTRLKAAACEVVVEGGGVTFPAVPNSGLLSWTVAATDSAGNATVQTCKVTVQDTDTPLANLPPAAGAGDDQVVPAGAVVTLDGSASADLDGDTLTYQWALTAAPAGSAATLAAPAAVRPTFVADLPGDYAARLVVSDGLAASPPDAVRVRALNGRPVADAGRDLQAFLGDVVAFDGSASFDPEGSALTYAWTLAYAPAGSGAALSDPAAPAPSLTPDVRGTYVARLAVDDGELSSPLDAVILRVVNRPPVAVAGADQEISVFDTVTLDGAGSFDPDGDPLSFSWSFLERPAGSAAALDDATAVAPAFVADLAGTYVLGLVVRDGFTAAAADTVSIVTVNTPPVAAAGPDQSVFVDDLITLDGSGSTDADGDPLTFRWSFASRPAGSSAQLEGATSAGPTFVPDVPGAYFVELVVDDGRRPSRPDVVVAAAASRVPVPDVVGLAQADAEEALAAAGFQPGAVAEEHSEDVPAGRLIRQQPPGGTLVAPGSAVDLVVSLGPRLAAIRVLPASDTILTGGSRAFTAFGIRDDGTSIALTASAAWSSSDSGVAVVDAAGLAVGVGAGVVTITAGAGGASGAATLTVVDRVSDGTPPVAEITSPEPGATVTSPVAVIGTAADANFLKYELAVAPAGEDAFTTIATGSSPVAGGVLAVFDPTLLVNDLYEVRLSVYDRGGSVVSTGFVCQVARDLKVGNFSLTIDDLQVPMAGLPITVSRTYDSRDRRPGDFGAGWRLEVNTLRVRETGVQGADWFVGKSDGPLPSFFLEPTTEHKVALTLPGGKVEEFDFTPQPDVSAIVPLQVLSPVYTPRPGTLGRLTVGDGDLLVLGGQPGPVQLVSSAILELYDPRVYTYTAADGRVFVIDEEDGVQSLRDRNGNTITVSAAGLIHSAGKSVAFARDARGRITAITDPNGNVQTYAYDANGDLVRHTDPAGNATEYRYDFRHLLIAIDDPLGRTPSRQEYDDDGRLVALVDAEGNRVELDHDVDGRREVVRDRLGNVTVLTYDDTGNVLSRTDALGQTTGMTYDGRGNVLSETDPRGHTTILTYDARDHVTSRTGALGHTETFTYNAFGQVLTHVDARGGVTTRTYDVRGNPLTETDPEGNVTRWTYDAAGNVLTMTDAEGAVTTMSYDTFGNVVCEVDPLGHAVDFTYDANGNQLSETRTRTVNGVLETLVTAFEHDGRNRLVATTSPDGGTTASTYDAAGSLVATTDPLGRVTVFEYDELERRVRTLYPDGTSEEVGYDTEGRIVARADRGGRTSQLEYDAVGRLVRETRADGSALSRTYDAASRLASVTDARGHTTTYLYDAAGRRTRIVDALGGAFDFAYDAAGNQVAVTDPNRHTTSFVYDAANRLVRTVFPDGTETSVTYDKLGRRTSETDQANRTTQFDYDDLGRLVAVTDALGQVTHYAYDEVGNRVSQIDANGHTTRFSYDGLGRQIRRILPDGKFEIRTYDAAGNLTTKTDFAGRTITYSHDANNRLTRKSLPDGTFVTFAYTATGRRESMVDARGATSYRYDVLDHLEEMTYPDGRSLSYTYDANGNRTSITAHVGGQAFTTTYTWDELDRQEAVTDPAGRTYVHGYDAGGNRISLAYPNGVVTTYAYDRLNRLLDLTTTTNVGAVLASFSYTLGPAGNRQRLDEHDGTSRSYVFDEINRLTQDKVTGAVGDLVYQSDFVYDAVGNRQLRSAAGADELETITYNYDSRDRLLTATPGPSYTWDANGNPTNKSPGTTYSWDQENRLVSVTLDDGTEMRSVYDADGNRVQQDVIPPDGSPEITYYLVDTSGSLSHVVVEISGDGEVRAVYVRAGDELLGVLRPQSGTDRYYHADGLRSVRLLTGSNGAVTDRYSYTAFGRLLEHQGTDPNPYRFAGEPFEPVTGLSYNRARWLDSSIGRFLGADPFPGTALDPRSLHPYLYAHSDPVNRADPTGRFTIGSVSSLVVVSAASILAVTPTAVFAGDGGGSGGSDSRPLTSGEVELVNSVFLGTVNTSKTKIFHRRWKIFHPKNVIMTPNGNIYYHPRSTDHLLQYSTDFSAESVHRQALFIHEMTHVWQRQHGTNVIWQGMLHRRYSYLPLDLGKNWEDFEIEQQGDIIRDYFYLIRGYKVDGASSICAYFEVIPWLPPLCSVPFLFGGL